MKAGFTGGVVVDYPNSTKAKKLLMNSIFYDNFKFYINIYWCVSEYFYVYLPGIPGKLNSHRLNFNNYI